MSGKFALIIGNTEYNDLGLAQLTAPGKDTEDFARVLKGQEFCAFDAVNILLNEFSSTVIEAIDEFFDQKKPDDLLVLYFSGHGVRDEFGSLYLAVKNTIRSRLRSTAIRSDYIREAIDQSRSKRQVVILDCCNSGAFPQGTKAEVGGTMGMVSAFQGYGRFILTASDATQFAWEGDSVIGETDNSLFTHFLVKGLEGEADNDGDGRITVDELYDYAYEQISRVTPRQTPTKSSSKQEGEIILRENMRIEDIKPVPLPTPLLDSIENPFADVRLGGVQQLIKLLNGKNLGLARSAREALERIAEEDDSRAVSQTAFQALEAILQAEQSGVQKAEEERLATEKAEAERKAKKEEAERLLAEHRAEEERIVKAKLKAERLATEKAKAARKAREAAERHAIQKAEEERLAREEAEAARKGLEETERFARAEVEREAARREPARLKAEGKAKEEVERLLAKKKLDEERAAKAKSDADAPKLSKASKSSSLDTPVHNQATRTQTARTINELESGTEVRPARATPTRAPVSSVKPQPFIRGWTWVLLALSVMAAFALFATIGGYTWWKTSLNEPQETHPELIAVSGADPTATDFPNNTPISEPINADPTNVPDQIIPACQNPPLHQNQRFHISRQP